MKYQQIIMAKRVSPDLTEFRQFYAPVEERNGRWVVSGPLREETDRTTQGSILIGLSAYEETGSEPDCDLSSIQAPPGWDVVASMWLPDDYVPESAEVREEGEKRAKDYLRRMLNDD